MSMLVSILVPVYNVQDYIERCINSIIRQSYDGPLECIIVDDCSTDNSMFIVNRVIKEYNGAVNFIIKRHSHNRGLAAARNTAVSSATGDFVMHVDSDDWLEIDAVKSLVSKQLLTDADIVSGRSFAHYADHNEIMRDPDFPNKQDCLLHMIELTIDHVLWRRIIRRRLYVDNKIEAVEGVNIGEDHHTLPRLIYYSSRLEWIDEVVYNYNCIKEHNSPKDVVYRGRENDLSSIDILMSFFVDKNLQCYESLKNIRVKFLQTYLDICFSYRDKKQFNNVVGRLYSNKSSCQDKRVENGVIKSIAYRSFYSYCFYKAFLKVLCLVGHRNKIL